MDFGVDWFLALITGYPLLKYLIIFLGAAFGGEVAVISLAFLAAQGVFPFPSYLGIAFLGTLFSDSIWFILGRTKTAEKIVDHKYAKKTIVVIFEAIKKISKGNHLFAFIFAKFLIGTRIVVIFYISKTKIAFLKFIKNDLLAIFIWLSILSLIGVLSGLGFDYLSSVLKNVYAGIGFVVLVLLLFFVVQIWLKKIFTKEGEEVIKEKDNMI
jgi:membrane protein DedA with SNARE-associated domain